jgi:Ca2+ transporting ATPase
MTPLQKKLETIAEQIGMVGFYVAVLTFAALLIRLMISTMFSGTAAFLTMNSALQILNFFIIAVTIIVVAVPEGLPLAVTISLAFSVSKMFKENNLVRRLHASETMGGANEICSDKTGTLTQNRMTVQSLYMAG